MAALPEATNHSAATQPTESTVSSKPTDSTVTIQQADTVRQKTTQLDEVVVNSDWQWRDGEKYVFLPQKQQRNLAYDAMSLLQRMNLPVLLSSSNGVTGLDGRPVKLYINGKEATDIDLNTFWPKQCLRVEFYENPTDPAFSGNKNVVNFIMPIYEWGGLTKLNLMQEFPDNGNYTAASKFSYKDMTYGVYLHGSYMRDHISGSSSQSDYYNLYYKENHYDHITSVEDRSDNAARNEGVAGSFSAVYAKGTTTISHQASLNWKRNPDSYHRGKLYYDPNIIDGSDMVSRSRSRTLSPVFTGRYLFRLPHTVYCDVKWQYSHNHNTAYSSYSAGNASPFFNASREDVNSVYGHLFMAKIMDRFLINGTLTTTYDWYRTTYDGTYANTVDQRHGNSILDLMLRYRFSDKFTMTLMPKIVWDYRNLDKGKTKHQLMPSAELNTVYNWNNNNSSSLYVFYYSLTPSAAEWSDAVVRQSELFWIKGNPNIKTGEHFSIDLSHIWRPWKFLNLNFSADWSRDFHSKEMIYYAAPHLMGGIIKEYSSTKGVQSFSFPVSANLRLLNGKVSLQLQVHPRYRKIYGNYADHLFTMRYRTWFFCYFGNFSAGAYFSTKQKYILEPGTLTRFNEDYNLNFGYGNGNINIYAELQNFLHKRHNTLEKQNNGIFTDYRRSWKIGRCLLIRLTYTFDYGKKLKDRSTINAESDSKTSVIQ